MKNKKREEKDSEKGIRKRKGNVGVFGGLRGRKFVRILKFNIF